MVLLCPDCFDNSIMKLRVSEQRRNRPNPHCTYHPNRKGVPVEQVAELLDPALRANYAITSAPIEYSDALSFHDVLFDVTGAVSDQIIANLATALIQSDQYDPRDGDMPFYGDDQVYEFMEPEGWFQSELWNEFRYRIKHEGRFFNDQAKALLKEIFDKVHLQTDNKGKPAFYSLDKSTNIFRARIVATIADAHRVRANPGRELGPPPEQLRRAGRMNAAGIGAFYGALDLKTCIAELRPPVGSLICVGAFHPIRQLHVLDFTRFERPGKQMNILAKNYVSRTTQWAFMQSFEAEIAQPVLPGDEHLEYVPSQAVAEYLASQIVTWRKKDTVIDGLVFRSAQRSTGKNVVLLGEAGLVSGGATPSPPDHEESLVHGYDTPSLPPRSPKTPALEFVSGSLEICSVTSATFDVEPEYIPGPAATDL